MGIDSDVTQRLLELVFFCNGSSFLSKVVLLFLHGNVQFNFIEIFMPYPLLENQGIYKFCVVLIKFAEKQISHI